MSAMTYICMYIYIYICIDIDIDTDRHSLACLQRLEGRVGRHDVAVHVLREVQRVVELLGRRRHHAAH